MERKTTLLYLLLAINYIVLSSQGSFTLDFIVKILPILLLIGVVFKVSRDTPYRGSLTWVMVALTWSMTGDILLAVDRSQLFIFGLGAFLVGHIFYLQSLRPMLRYRFLLLVPYAAYAFAVMTLMSPNLGPLYWPVLAYMSIILFMSWATWNTSHSNPWLILGGLSFILSDSLIGIDKFYQPVEQAGMWIMITYYGAQLLLVHGFLKRHKRLHFL